MFIVTHKKELAIGITPDPYNRHLYKWSFYDSEWEYNFDLEHFADKYGKKFIITLASVEKKYKKGYDEES